MATCEFTNITNQTSGTIMVTKLEDIGRNSLVIEPGESTQNLIWLPKITKESDFVKKTLMVLSLPDQRVLGFLWQRDDAIIRMSLTGYDPSASPLEGRNTDRVTLTVKADQSLRGD